MTVGAGGGLSPLDRYSVANLLATYELRFTNEVSVAYDTRDHVLKGHEGLDTRVLEAMQEFSPADWLKAETITEVVQRSGYLAARGQTLDSAD